MIFGLDRRRGDEAIVATENNPRMRLLRHEPAHVAPHAGQDGIPLRSGVEAEVAVAADGGVITTPIIHAELHGQRITPNVYTMLDDVDRSGDMMLEAAARGVSA